jgi:nucleoside-diphosphate-sugar epimerase
MEQGPTILIAGSGYVGGALGRAFLARGEAVLGLSRSAETAAQMQAGGWFARAADISDQESCLQLADAFPEIRKVIHCAASGRGGGEEQYRAVYEMGCRNLWAAFPHAEFYFTSSTSVYPQIDGSIITETTPAEPKRGTGQILRAAET